MKWTQSDIDILRRQYATVPTYLLAQRFNRSAKAIGLKAHELGLKKAYNAGRFKRGQQPWNIGKSFNAGGRSISTRFKPGNIPHTAKIGIDKWLRSDHGKPYWFTHYNGKAIPMHRALWLREYGPIPVGYIVTFKDGNQLNCTLDNLHLISRGDNLRRNSEGRIAERSRTLRYVKAKGRQRKANVDWVDAVLQGIV